MSTEPTKIDLDDIERKARAAVQEPWETDEVRGRHPDYTATFAIVRTDGGEQIADAYDNTRWPDDQCAANAAHIAAASPSVVIALIARIRLLERTVGQAATLLEAKSGVAARREWAKRIRVHVGEDREAADVADGQHLERLAKAATAFVDEQGKHVSIERGHTIGQAEDFAGEQFAELVRAVEAAGR